MGSCFSSPKDSDKQQYARSDYNNNHNGHNSPGAGGANGANHADLDSSNTSDKQDQHTGDINKSGKAGITNNGGGNPTYNSSSGNVNGLSNKSAIHKLRMQSTPGNSDSDLESNFSSRANRSKSLGSNAVTGAATTSGSMGNANSSGGTNSAGADGSSNKEAREVKILLLGSGESGKSTILKQMKIMHQNGYSQEELLMYKTTVYKNLVDCAKTMISALSKFGIDITTDGSAFEKQDDSSNVALAITISNTTTETTGNGNSDSLTTTAKYTSKTAPRTNTTNGHHAPKISKQDLELVETFVVSPDPDSTLDSHVALVIKALWAHPTVKKMFNERRSDFYIMDSAPYFFDNVDRIGDPDYIPTVDDILRARIKTTGIYESRFDMGGLNVHMYDVGGQRSERKKWIHCFDNVTLIIYCVALSEYDQVLLEEKNQNRMAESLVLFESVLNSPWFARTSVVLFLNKIDVFTEKLPYSPLENYFPDYTGGNDINKAAKYILWRFTQVNRTGLNIYPHLTQATDTSNIRLVFAAVKETILQNALRDSGIL